jgi:glutaminyl-tRNA synthetase
LNPNSLEILTGYVEPLLSNPKVGSRYQFERLGYFCVDRDSTDTKPVFNLTVNLKDTWSKIAQKQK